MHRRILMCILRFTSKVNSRAHINIDTDMSISRICNLDKGSQGNPISPNTSQKPPIVPHRSSQSLIVLIGLPWLPLPLLQWLIGLTIIGILACIAHFRTPRPQGRRRGKLCALADVRRLLARARHGPMVVAEKSRVS